MSKSFGNPARYPTALGPVSYTHLDVYKRQGEYIPTKKNGMVKDHYAKLGFTVMETDPSGGSRAVLDLAGYTPPETFIHVTEG